MEMQAYSPFSKARSDAIVPTNACHAPTEMPKCKWKDYLALDTPVMTTSTRHLAQGNCAGKFGKSFVLADFMPGSGIGLRILSIPKSTSGIAQSAFDRL